MSAASRRRFADAVRAEPVDVGLACLLVGAEVDPSLDVDAALERLDVLAADVLRPPAPTARDLALALQVTLRDFGGTAPDYDDVRSSLLHEVLRRPRGLPITLSVLWTELAHRRGIPAYLVALPGHVVVGIGDPDDEHVHVDPFSGGRLLDRQDVDALVLAATGRPAAAEDLRPADAHELLLRLLTNVRALTARQAPSLETARTRLWATELSLLLPRHPLALRRERGELLVRLGDHVGGASELEDYALVVEDQDATAAEQARREARQARARLN